MSPDSIYLSPHLDDAVLSCGGQIAQQAQGGQGVLVVTVCAGDPPPTMVASGLVRTLHARWGQARPVAARRAEDEAALRVLHADALHWDVPDSVYRPDAQTGQALYPDQAAIFGQLAQQEADLVGAVVDRLRRLEPLRGARVYVPLGIGHHVDHQLVLAAARAWGTPGGQLIYYEDYPYAEKASAVEAALTGLDLTPHLVYLDRRDLARKVTAVGQYQSQLSTFFARQPVSHRLEAFARARAGGAGLAERVWGTR
jgi:LmbE family N-acetylglucosaminyl deacetylase